MFMGSGQALWQNLASRGGGKGPGQTVCRKGDCAPLADIGVFRLQAVSAPIAFETQPAISATAW